MPSLSWIQVSPVGEQVECVMVTTQAALRHRWDMVHFVAAAQGVFAGLKSAEGLVGYGLQASVARGTLVTVSAWRTHADVEAFSRGRAHRLAVQRTRRLVTGTRINSWLAVGGDLSSQADRFMHDTMAAS